MLTATQKAIEDWDNEVDLEMEKLIREGTPPLDACDIARNNVSRRRMEKARVSNHPTNRRE